jgi:hypothetical protein
MMTRLELKTKLLNKEFDCMIDFWMEAEEVLKGTTIWADYGAANFSEKMTNDMWMQHHRQDSCATLQGMRDSIGLVELDYAAEDSPQEFDAGTSRDLDWRMNFERFVFIDGQWRVVCQGVGLLSIAEICEIRGGNAARHEALIVRGWRLT